MIDVEHIVKNSYHLATKTAEVLGRVSWSSEINIDDIKRAYTDIYTDILISHADEPYILVALQAYVSSLGLKTHVAPKPPQPGNSYSKFYTWWHKEFISDLFNPQKIHVFIEKEMNYMKSCETKLMVQPDRVHKNAQEAYETLSKQLVVKST